MKFINKLALFLLVTSLFACQNNSANNAQSEQEAEEKVWSEMMAIHDEVMPKMSTINSLSQMIKKPLATDPPPADTIAAVFEKALADLETAEEGMWDWMNQLQKLNKLRATKSHEEIMTYLNAEKQKVQKVRSDMLNSIQAAAILAKVPAGSTPQSQEK